MSKSKYTAAKRPGLHRQNALRLLRYFLGQKWRTVHAVALEAKVSDRTVERLLNDAGVVGYDVEREETDLNVFYRVSAQQG